MKNNIDFYQHYADADQHPKFKMLRVQFGWEGEGKFWALNNRIAQAEDCCLNISKKYNKAAIASDLDFSLPKFEEFISFLLVECELIKECSPGIITTDIIQENFDRVSVNREKARDRKQRYLEKVLKGSTEKKESSGEQNNKVKVKESKDKEIYSRVINYLNKKTGKNYKLKTQVTLRFINARLNDGFTPEDFKSVIDIKTKQWLNDPENNKYLRPETLFGNKFESYLNENQNIKTLQWKEPTKEEIEIKKQEVLS